jgi:peptidoglycan hydrolase-like protein with peptidoglycan-binding domain
VVRLTRPVGQWLPNVPGDVRYVQFLLNDWRRGRGRPTLVEDGIAGPLTSAAIREFQKAETGIVDGRIDTNGAAIRKLEYRHILRLVNEVYVYSLEHYAILSMTPPRFGPVTMPLQANQYLTALRRAQR